MFETTGALLLVFSGIAVFFVVLMIARAVSGNGVGARQKKQAQSVIVDGSNVMHWDGGTPRIKPVQSVVDRLKDQGYMPGVVFDANAGYLLTGKYQHDMSLSRELGLPEKNVMVVPKGTPADPMILQAARDMNARVVSNDRFRDWAGEFPEIRRKGFLIRGRYKSGSLTLNLPVAAPQASETAL